MSHSPAPWKVDHRGTTIVIRDDDDNEIACVVPDDLDMVDVDLANGHVLAAAPDLLASLKFVAQQIHQAYHDGEPAHCDRLICRDARKTIAKAEGKP